MARYWEKLAKLKSKPTEDDKFSASLLKFQAIEGSPFAPSAYDKETGSIIHGGEMVSEQGQVLPSRLTPITSDEDRLQASLMENMGAPSYYNGGLLGQGNIQDTRFSPQPYQQPQQTPTAQTQPTQIQPTQIQPTTAQTNVNQSVSTLRPPTQQSQAAPVQAVPPPMAQTVAPQYRADVDTGMGLLRSVATGEDSVYDQQRDVAAGQLGAQQAATQAAQQQTIAQQGASPEMAGVLGADLSRRQEIAQGDLQTEFGLAESAAQLAAGKDLMTTSLGLDQLDYGRTQSQIDQLLTLGGEENIQKAEELGAQLYGFGIDYSKAGLADVEANMNNIMTWVEQFGTDAPPEVLQIMGQKYGELMTQQNAIRGLDYTPEQIEQMSSAIINNNPEVAEPALQLGAGVMDWWDNGNGSPLKMMLTGSAAQARDILSDPNASPEAKQRAAIEMGEIVGTAFYAMEDYGDMLTDQQRELLNNSGLGMLSGTEAASELEAQEKQDIISGWSKNVDEIDWTQASKDPELMEAAMNIIPELPPTSATLRTRKRDFDGNTRRVQDIAEWAGIGEGDIFKVAGQPIEWTSIDRDSRGRDYVIYTLTNKVNGKTVTLNTRNISDIALQNAFAQLIN